MTRNLRILFLPKYPIKGASSRYRVYQFLPLIKNAGFDYTVSPLYNDAQFERLMQHGGGIRTVSMMCRAFLKRICIALTAFRYDIVYMQREVLPVGPLWLEQFFNYCGAKTVFDYDDALFLYKANVNTKAFNFFKQPKRIAKIMEKVDCVNASNAFLAKFAQNHCNRVYNIPGAEDMNRLGPKDYSNKGSQFIIGWMGSPSTERYLNLIKPDLQRLAKEIPNLQLNVIGGRGFTAKGVKVVHIPWSLEVEETKVSNFDVGIMPLPEDSWSEGKSGGKARFYMAVGVPPVATATDYNRELIKPNVTGVLIEHSSDWYTQLLELARTPELRRRQGEAARAYVKEHLSVDVVGKQMITMLKELVQK